MSSSSVLKKIGDKATGAASALKSLPPDSNEAESLKEKQAQVDAVSGKTALNTTPAPEASPSEQDKVNPLSRYGSQQGEKRLDTSYLNVPTAVKAPIYDAGGDVGIIGGTNNNLRKLGAPVLDEGGDAPVNVNDGNHQIAVLKDGEKVLSPEQADQYRAEHPEHGAPAGFPGMVLPNPKGIKVSDSDNPEPKPSDTDRLPTGVKANTDNAPLETPKGDTSNPPTAQLAKPGAMHEVSTDTGLKPYSQVMEDKAKAKAAEQVNNPNPTGQPSTASSTETQVQPGEGQAVPEEKPKATLGQPLAQAWLKRMGVTSPTDLMQTPKEFNQGAPDQGAVEQGMPAPKGMNQGAAPQPGLKPIVQPEATAPAVLKGKEAFQSQIKMYDTAYQSAMDKAAATNDPQYREQAARIQEAKQAYEKAHPWGSPESAHPGVLGRLGHIASRVGNIAGDIAAPGLMEITPGTDLHKAVERGQTARDVKEASAQNAAENKVTATAIPGYHQVTGGATDPQHPELGPQVAFESEKDPTKIVYQGPITPKAAAGGDKAAFEKTLAQIGSADVADPTKQQAAIEQAHTDKKITDEQYNNANAYLGSTANAPATQAGAAQVKEDQKIAAGFRGKTLVFQNPDGSRQGMTYEQAKAEGRDLNGAMSYTPMAADKLRTSEKSYHNALQMFGDYEKDINKSSLSLPDEDALKVLTSHADDAVSSGYLGKEGGSLMDIFSGEPLTGYNKKLMGGAMTADQYAKMGPAARTLLADYFQAMLSHFQSIKDTQGSIPRNPEMIRTEMGAIPMPFLKKEEAAPAFTKYFDRMHNMNVDAVRFGKPEQKPEQLA